MRTFFFRILKTSGIVFAVVWSFFAALFTGLLFVMLLGLGIGLATQSGSAIDQNLEYTAGNENAEHSFVAIPVEGLILGEPLKTDSLLELFSEQGVTYGYEVKELLIELADEDSVDGVVLEIHSPGGTLFGTKAITDGVAYYQEKTGKPVYAYIGSLASSGGYWAAVSADQVYADLGTTMGSIGVITGPFKYYDQVISEGYGIVGPTVETTGGISTEYITAGRHKDLGNPYRQLSEEERTVMQASVDQAYQAFIEYVAERRGLEVSMVDETVGALIYGEVQSKELGLIDEIADKQTVYKQLATNVGIAEDEFKIMRPYRELGFFESMLSSFNSAPQPQAGLIFCTQPVAMAFAGDLQVYCQ